MSGQPIVAALMVDPAAGDQVERLTTLFDAHQDRLYRLARRLTTNRDDACDLVQETFLRTAQSPGSVPLGHASEEAWLVRVLVNIRRDQWRKAAVKDRFAARLAPAAPADASNPESALIARTAVWKALEVLHPRRRAVIVLHELDGLTVPAIASLLGISPVTVRWHLSRGRRDLKLRLKTFIGDNA